MNKAAIYHRPESEYAFLYTANELRVRVRTALDDIAQIMVVSGDPYDAPNGVWNKQEDLVMTRGLTTDTHQYWEASLNAPYNRLNYGFIITGLDGEETFYGDQGFEAVLEDDAAEYDNLMGSNSYFKMPYFQEIDRFKAPEWVKETVWYQIFPERFANGDPSNDNEGTLPWQPEDHPTRDAFYGGDLRGVIDHLDHLVDLGVNGIYFNPIFEAPTNHKYDTRDYLAIDPHFGTKEDFKELVDKAHDLGIKVMLDAVFNHIGDESPEWLDVLKNGAASRYADWFHIHSFPARYTATDDFETARDATYETFAFTPHMPKLNTANPEVQDYLLNIATYWIREFNIDAWRIDVANEVDHHFWKRFYKAVTALNPDFYVLGEIWTSAQSWLRGDEFNGVMNYAFTGSIVDYFARRKISAEKMVSNLSTQLMLNRDQTNQMMYNLLDSHDAPRILSVAQGNKDVVKQMYAFMLLQQGTPDIYYGSEYAMAGEQDPDNRKPMEWRKEKQDHDMYQFMKNLIALRRSHVGLLVNGNLTFDVEVESDIVSFTRALGEDYITAVFNAGERAFSLPASLELTENQILLSNGYADQSIRSDGFVVFASK
ncbi:glycoside hydrolase family 13 protein [Lactococcus insecticola]|uniref:Alpha-glycosidase n=1 Tax=Pseudolactococcus insecticola TaxID=2709158 RepID=A0A6A0B4L9_9LACT|nr:glycoside hydrolase family 13 protein [Lactococcus insecticola]GFH40132.1 alpha-glycosidase [Lactococcus insecticola]